MIFREYFLKGKEPFMEYKNVIAIDAMVEITHPQRLSKVRLRRLTKEQILSFVYLVIKIRLRRNLINILIIRNRLGLLIQRRRLVVMKLLQWQLRRRKILL